LAVSTTTPSSHRTHNSDDVVSVINSQDEATVQTDPVIPETPVRAETQTHKKLELTFQPNSDQAQVASSKLAADVTSTSSAAVQTSQAAAAAAPTVTPAITGPVVAASVPNPSPPVVIVRQFQTPKPYSGQTSHRSFREHFERVAKANGWTTELERMQNLALALEGPAIECLKEVQGR